MLHMSSEVRAGRGVMMSSCWPHRAETETRDKLAQTCLVWHHISKWNVTKREVDLTLENVKRKNKIKYFLKANIPAFVFFLPFFLPSMLSWLSLALGVLRSDSQQSLDTLQNQIFEFLRPHLFSSNPLTIDPRHSGFNQRLCCLFQTLNENFSLINKNGESNKMKSLAGFYLSFHLHVFHIFLSSSLIPCAAVLRIFFVFHHSFQ